MTLSQEKRDNVGEYLFNADEMESIEISEKDLHKRKKCEMSTEITEGETLDFVIKREDVGEGISMKVFSEIIRRGVDRSEKRFLLSNGCL